MYVLVAQYRDQDGTMKVGAVHGPYDTREEAHKEKDGFPHPEWVYIRKVG